MENATLTPFSYLGSGSAFKSQYTSWLPSASRFVSEVAVGGGAEDFAGFGEVAFAAFGVLVLALAAFLGGGDLNESLRQG